MRLVWKVHLIFFFCFLKPIRPKDVDHKGHYVKKCFLFGHIPWKYQGKPIDFLDDLFI